MNSTGKMKFQKFESIYKLNTLIEIFKQNVDLKILNYLGAISGHFRI